MPKMSDAARAKMRARWSPERREAQRQRMLGNKINFGKHHSAKTRRAIGKAQDGVPCPQRGRPGVKRAWASEVQKRRWSVPENRKRFGEKMREHWSKPNTKERLGAAIRQAYMNRPELRLQKSANMKRMWLEGIIGKPWTQDRKEIQSIRNRVNAKRKNPNSKARYTLSEYARWKSAVKRMNVDELNAELLIVTSRVRSQ